jgi:hypothetical protein
MDGDCALTHLLFAQNHPFAIVGKCGGKQVIFSTFFQSKLMSYFSH